jgi:hypothetical protein
MGLPSLNPDLLPRVSPGPLSNLDGTIHGQAAWIPALGGVERKEHPAGTRPSIGSSNKRPQLPSWGRVF